MEHRTHAQPGLAALTAGLTLILAPGLLVGCGGDEGSGAPGGSGKSALAAATAEVEWYDPETRRLKKSEGQKLYGQFVGERTWWHPNQTIARTGQYDEQGRETGGWMEYHEIGVPAAKFTYVDGQLDGELVRWHATGDEAEKGRYDQGEQVGEWRAWYPGGKLRSVFRYADGVLDGECVEYYPSGEVGQRMTFDMGKKEGVHETFAEDGTLLQRAAFASDMPVSDFEAWYPSGQRRHVKPVEAGVPHGTEMFWWESGEVRAQRTYERGRRVGLEKNFHENGERALEVRYVDDQMEGVLRVWHPSGHLQALVDHEGGQRVGLARNWSPAGVLTLLENYVAGQKYGLQQTWFESGARKSVASFEADELEGPRFVWAEDGGLMEDLSGLYRGGQRVRPLDDDERARAAELAGAPAPIELEGEPRDPLSSYDERGEPRSAEEGGAGGG